MRIKSIKTLISVGIMSVCLCLASLSYDVHADSNSITVSPPHQKMLLTPGETYEGSLSVSNASNSTRDTKYEVKIGSFSQTKSKDDDKDDYTDTDIVTESSYNQIMGWIKLGDTGGTIAPGQTKRISYTINVPESAPAGGQYATIIVVDKTTSGTGGEGNISIDNEYQFASIIYAEVAGESRKTGEITENAMPSFLLNGPLTASSMVKNTGNVHTNAKYTLQVWPMFSDEEICTNVEEPEERLILPETERYHTQTCDLPSIGIFRAKQVVEIFGETSTVEKIIVICPLWLLFLIVFIIISVIIWIFVKVKGGKKRSSNKESSGSEA